MLTAGCRTTPENIEDHHPAASAQVYWKVHLIVSYIMSHAHPVGDVHGQRWNIEKSTVTAQTTNSNTTVAMVMAMATTVSNVHNKTTNPTTKKTTANSSKAGMAEIPVGTFQSSHASMRSCRTRTVSRGDAATWAHCRYSRIHCLAKMPNSAEARLKTRLKNHRTLIHLADAEGWNGDGDDENDVVELRKGNMLSKLLSCEEIRYKSCAEI